MKVRLLLNAGGYKTGDIVEAKRFKDFTPEEISHETQHPDWWNGSEIFIKRIEPYEGSEYLFMFMGIEGVEE